MDTKKRNRENEAVDEEDLASKRPRSITDAELHQVNKQPHKYHASEPFSLIDSLITAESATEAQNPENGQSFQDIPRSGAVPLLPNDVRPKKALHTIVPRSNPQTASLFQTASLLDQDVPSMAPFELVGTSPNDTMAKRRSNHVQESIFESVSLFAPARSLKPSLHSFPSLNGSSAHQAPLAGYPPPETASTATDTTTSVESTLFSLNSKLEEDEEFEAILAAAKARQSAQPPRQLHQPKNSGTFAAQAPLHDTRAKPAGSMFQSARSLDVPGDPMAGSAPSTSLFASASSMRGSPEASPSVNPEAVGSSLFTSARNLSNGPSTSSGTLATHMIATESAVTVIPSTEDIDDDFEAMLSSLRNKKPQRSAPLFRPPTNMTSGNTKPPSKVPEGVSLFQSARSIPSTESAHIPNDLTRDTHVKDAPGAEGQKNDEEDEFELFMKTLSAQRKGPPSPAPPKRSAVSSHSLPSALPRGNQRPAARQKTSSGPRPFKAPAVINPVPLRAQNDTFANSATDEVEDALLSLLDDEDELLPSSPTPGTSNAQEHHPPSPVTLRSYSKAMEERSTFQKPDTSLTPLPRVLPEEHADLLAGIDFEEPIMLTPTTPKSSMSNKRFYASQSPQSPSSPSSSRRSGPGLSSRGTVRSSPYSLTASQAMPLVSSTPTKIMEIPSPVRLSQTSLGIPSPTNSNKRSRPAFTSPPQVAANGGGTSENLRKKQKNVLYGRTAAYTAQPASTASVAKSKPLFDLDPSEELKASRQPLTSLGRAPHAASRGQLLAYKMRPELVDMTSESSKRYVFEQMNAEGVLQKLNSVDFFKVLLSEGASPKYMTQAWVDNHYRWIVWKLASMERSFPHEFANTYLTAERVLAQLKYRYEREINRAQRPPLRKILEHDASASSHVVFVVASIKHDGSSVRVTGDDMKALSETGGQSEDDPERLVKSNSAIIEVSDGWYSMNAILDPYLTRLVQEKLIFTGQKLHIFGATIVGNDNPTPPLEITPSTMLKLGINGVRRAKWFSRLGFHARSPLPSLRISSLKMGGGIVPKLDALILRVYPLIFTEEVPISPNSLEKSKNGEEIPPFFRLSRSAHGEDIAMDRYMKRREDWYEMKTRELTIEILRESKNASHRASNISGHRIGSVDVENEGSTIEYEHMAMEGALTPSQQLKLEERLREAAEVEPWLERQVSPAIRILICDYPGDETSVASSVVQHLASHGAEGLMMLSASQKKALHSLGKAILTIYNINEELLARLKEGTRIQASFIAFKGDPIVSMQKSNFSNFSAEDDNITLQSEHEISTAPINRLTSTTYTGFEFPSTKNDETARTLVQLFSRVATHFDCLDSRLKLRDIPIPSSTAFDFDSVLDYERRKLIDRFTVSNEFDGVGVVMSVLPKVIVRRCKLAMEPELNALKDEYQMDVFLADPSGNLLALRIESIQDNMPSPFAVGSILCFKNATYDGYDAHLGLHSATSTETTEWVTKVPSTSHLKLRRDEILSWMDSMDFNETMEILASKIVDISSGAITKAKPGIDTTNAIYTTNAPLSAPVIAPTAIQRDLVGHESSNKVKTLFGPLAT